MSAELYVGHRDSLFRRQRDGRWHDLKSDGILPDKPEVATMIVPNTDRCSRKRSRDSVFDESNLDDIAHSNGYSKIQTLLTAAPLASYSRGSCRLNFWLTTGNVGAYVDHPTQGRVQIVHRDINLNEAERIFQNPWMHNGPGCRRGSKTGGRRPCRFGQYGFQADWWLGNEKILPIVVPC